MHHSDRGSQYASHAFQRGLEKCGMICSTIRKGNCWDNAPTESWFNSFKNERVHGLHYETRAEMTGLLLNRKRNWQYEPYLLEDENLGEPQSNHLHQNELRPDDCNLIIRGLYRGHADYYRIHSAQEWTRWRVLASS